MAQLLFILPKIEAFGGTERIVLGLADGLSRSHDVFLCCFAIDPAASTPASVELHVLGTAREQPLVMRWLTYVDQARKLRAVKRNIRPDVSISNLWRADLVNVLSRTAEPKIAVLHAGVSGPANRMLRRFRWLAARVYRNFAHIVAVSPGIAEEAQQFYGVPPERVRTIPNSVQVAAEPASNKAYDLLWCGRFTEEKNPLGAVGRVQEISRNSLS